MIALATTVLVASLVGSPHCAGMCGGIAAFCAGAGECNARSSGLASLSYHGARLVSYAIVGLLAGALGTLLNAGGALVGIQQIAAALAGATIALVGCALLIQAAGSDMGRMKLPKWMQKALSTIHRTASRFPPVPRSLLVGLATPLLPCGWLWSFAAVSAGTGSPLGGAVVMIMFWAGTVPLLALVGVGIAALGGRHRKMLAALAGVAMIAVGIYTGGVRSQFAPSIARRLDARGAETAPISATGELVPQTPACCQKDGPSQ